MKFFKISNIALKGNRADKQTARELLAGEYNLERSIASRALPMHLVGEISVSALDRKVKHGGSLSFEEAFVAMLYIIAATNSVFLKTYSSQLAKAYGMSEIGHDHAIAIGSAFLNLMALKEAYVGLTSEEIAGLVAAGLLDTVFSLDAPNGKSVLETAGMGGDRGFGSLSERKKSINVSTMSGLVLAAAGHIVAKHGSYANSTVVGSTDSLELFGADTTPRSIEHIKSMMCNGFVYLDAHLAKTLHDLSHLLMMETINHVVGPMTPPLAASVRLLKLMGVNEKVSPRAVAQAYAKLHQQGTQHNAGAIIIAGLSQESLGMSVHDLSDQALRRLTILDELSPFASLVSMTVGSTYLGDDVITPADFGISINPEHVYVAGDRAAIHAANISAISGKNPDLVRYLAMNAALGMYLEQESERHLQANSAIINREKLVVCYVRCIEIIRGGGAHDSLMRFVSASTSG